MTLGHYDRPPPRSTINKTQTSPDLLRNPLLALLSPNRQSQRSHTPHSKTQLQTETLLTMADHRLFFRRDIHHPSSRFAFGFWSTRTARPNVLEKLLPYNLASNSTRCRFCERYEHQTEMVTRYNVDRFLGVLCGIC